MNGLEIKFQACHSKSIDVLMLFVYNIAVIRKGMLFEN
jgi:hypothetical protein